MVPATLVSVWLRSAVLDTENFVGLYQPLAEKSDFQGILADSISDATASAVEDSGMLEAAGSTAGEVDRLLGQFGVDLGLAEKATNWSDSVVDQVRQTVHDHTLPVIQEPAFGPVWTESLRQIHSQVIAGLDGTGDGHLSLEASPYVEMLLTSLQEQGYSMAQYIPTPGDTVRIDIATLNIDPHMQERYSLLHEYGPWMPLANIGILVLGAVVANHHARALGRAGIGVLVASVAVWLAAPRLGTHILESALTSQQDQALATMFWNVGIAPLQEIALWVAAGALVVTAFSYAVNSLKKRD